MKNRNSIILSFMLILFVVLKAPVVGLPLHWDELLYVSTAFYLSSEPFYLTKYFDGEVARYQGNPPAYYQVLALAYVLLGYSLEVTRIVSITSALAAIFFTFRVGEHLGGFKTGFLSASFLAVSPLFFAQSGLAHADILLTALAISTAYFYLKGNHKSLLVSASLLVLTKPQGLFIITAVIVFEVLVKKRGIGGCIRSGLAMPIVLFIAWSFLFKKFAGFFFTSFYMTRLQSLSFFDLDFYKLVLHSVFI